MTMKIVADDGFEVFIVGIFGTFSHKILILRIWGGKHSELTMKRLRPEIIYLAYRNHKSVMFVVLDVVSTVFCI